MISIPCGHDELHDSIVILHVSKARHTSVYQSLRSVKEQCVELEMSSHVTVLLFPLRKANRRIDNC